MVSVFWEWLDLGVRWTHVIAGIAWIGSSFYFVHLDFSLKQRPGLPEGAAGDAWQVHGGGFYHMVKYLVAPTQMPESLTWFKWEAYATWLSGMGLLIIVYYFGAQLYLIDTSVLALPVWAAVLISVAGLALGWVVYDRLCKSRLGDNDTQLFVVLFLFLVVLAFAYNLRLQRARRLHADGRAGRHDDGRQRRDGDHPQPEGGRGRSARRPPARSQGSVRPAKQRSLHNNYLTLPVIFVMIANHYPLAFATRWNWAIFGLVLVIGAVIRHFYNSRHKGLPSPWWTWAVAAAGMVLVMLLSAAGPSTSEEAAAPPAAPVTFAQAEEVVLGRCSMCHTAEPAWEGIAAPPKGVMLDTPERITLQAHNIALQAVRTHAMPPGNITEITPEERAILAAWVASGARME